MTMTQVERFTPATNEWCRLKYSKASFWTVMHAQLTKRCWSAQSCVLHLPKYSNHLTQIQRLSLPIAQERENILRQLEEHQVLVICGATGSGKSTQLPTYILEHEMLQGRHCNVICT